MHISLGLNSLPGSCDDTGVRKWECFLRIHFNPHCIVELLGWEAIKPAMLVLSLSGSLFTQGLLKREIELSIEGKGVTGSNNRLRNFVQIVRNKSSLSCIKCICVACNKLSMSCSKKMSSWWKFPHVLQPINKAIYYLEIMIMNYEIFSSQLHFHYSGWRLLQNRLNSGKTKPQMNLKWTRSYWIL